MAQALLASDLSSELNNLVAAAVKGSATIYDKAMDANYLDPLLRPDLGGSYHRLFDGGHTIAGAVRAARGASPDDTIIEEALGTVQALLRDAATPSGPGVEPCRHRDLRQPHRQHGPVSRRRHQSPIDGRRGRRCSQSLPQGPLRRRVQG